MSETTVTGTVTRSWDPVMRTPAARLHAAAGAVFRREAGWELPASYGDPDAERRYLQEAVGIVDVTPRGKIDVRGHMSASMPASLDGGIVARISDTWTLVLTEPGGAAGLASRLEVDGGSASMVTDVTHLYAGYVLAGPRLHALLERLTSFDAAGLEPGAAAGAPIVDIRAVWRSGELAVPLVEVYVATEFGRYAWRALEEVVRALGGGAVGWDALRVEGWR